MRELPFAADIDFAGLPIDQVDNPLWVAQQIVTSDPTLRSPLLHAVAEHLRPLEAVATPSPALDALARTPNRPALVLTLNYDRLVEAAARANGRDAHTLGIDDIPSLINDGLVEPDGSLRVLHLHGSLGDEPDELVLDASSYAERAGEQRVRDLFSALLGFFNLCIIGSSFEEQYLATALLARRASDARHVIVCDGPVADRILNGQAALSEQVHNVLVCDYPPGDHVVLDEFCERLVRCAPPPSDEVDAVTAVTPDVDPLYEPRRFVESRERAGEGESDIEVSLAFGQLKVFTEEDVRAEARAVVVGTPGAGKSRLLEHLATSPAHGERGVLVRLRDIREVLGEPERLLTAWVAQGRVLDGGGPIPLDAVGEGTARVHLLLDGLDELPREQRVQVAEAVAQVGRSLPEQRLTLSSRPSAALEVLADEWRQFDLLCDATWRAGLLRRADTDETELADSLGPLYAAVEPLLRVPFFLRGMLDLLHDGEVPDDGLDLVLSLLRRLLRSDEQLQAFGEPLDEWLRKVALTMLLNNTTTVSSTDLQTLAADLEVGDPSLVADLLASRSLLLEASGTYSFQHRLFGEALVAEFLLTEAPEEWLDVLAPSVNDHSALREDWAGVADLLLPRSRDWRAALFARDPRAAARATPPTADLDEREQAARLLWERAQRLDIWIDPGGLTSDRTDGEVVSTLMAAGGLGDLEHDVITALTAGSRFQRGNAVDIVAGARLPDTEAILRRVLVEDEDSVVRRSAASAARRLNLQSLLGPLERRASSPDDNAEAGDLASVALALTPRAERLELAMRLLAAGNTEVRDWLVVEDLSPNAQLRWLAHRAHAGEDESWWAREHLDDVIAAIRRPTRRNAAHVGLVAAVARTRSETVLNFLRNHQAAAIGLIDALDEELVYPYEVIDLLLAVGSTALRRHGASQRVLEQVEAWEHARANPAPAATDPPAAHVREEPPTRPTLEEVLLLEDPDVRLGRLLSRGDRLARQVPDASETVKERLAAELDRLWGDQNLREAVSVQGTQANIRHWAAAVIEYGPPLEWEIGIERWTQVALCEWLFEPQVGWLRSQVDGARIQRALEQEPSPKSLVDLALLSPADELPRVVERILDVEPGSFPPNSTERIVAWLAEQRRPDLLAEIAAHDPAIGADAAPHLAAAGDLDAQKAQLESLIGQLQAGEHVDRWSVRWLDAVDDESLFDLIATAIPLAGRTRRSDESPFDHALASLQAALERTDAIRAIEFYDDLTANPPWFGAQFLIENRDAVVQRLIAPGGQEAAADAAHRLGLPFAP